MTADLELTVLSQPSRELGALAGFAVTDQRIVGLGPAVAVSADARNFEHRKAPGSHAVHAALAVVDQIWACGETGQLAVSRDHGTSWKTVDTGTRGCLRGLALGANGALWVVGDDGFAGRLLGERVQRIDLGTTAQLTSVTAVRDEIVVLGSDGVIRRWRDGAVTSVACGAAKSLTAFALTSKGTWIAVGQGGFIARSPDGQWFSRAPSTVQVDLEAVHQLRDGRLIVVGDRSQILLSADDGRTWRALPNDLPLSHLRALEPFGGGLLIGGEDGLVAKLAPRGDTTWSDRAPAAPGAKPLDAAFAVGPEGFIVGGLAPYLEVIEKLSESEDEDEDDEDDDDDDDDVADDDDADDDDDLVDNEEDDDDEDDADDDSDDEDDDEDDDDEDDDDDEPDEEAFRVLGTPGTPADFRDIYGLPMPFEAKTFFEAVDGKNPWSSFEELRLDNDLRPDVGELNLFELMVRRNQHAYLGTDLVEAFCGVFGLGSQGNGDTYHLELYEWDGPRQVLHYDHETHAFSGVFSDSLDSLVYLAAIVRAAETGAISSETYEAGLHALRGKVAPTWHFSIDDKDPDFTNLEPKRRDSEFFFYRSRWIVSLLKNDGVTEIADLPQLFMADFNQVIPEDQLDARFEACEKFIPTALYAMWRAFLFEEDHLERYLEIGRKHPARLVRDAARLIDELRAGRNELGTIEDVRAHIAAFRALDLDPRRAEARSAEAAARSQHESDRKSEVTAELDSTPAPQWTELAWRWLGDGVAHRTLLERLDQTQHTQVVALDELRTLRDDERAASLSQLATQLSPELEAVLVGSLVRDDALAGVLERPPAPEDEADEDDDADDDDEDDDDDDDDSPGWEAIDAALQPIYGDEEPQHFGAIVPYMLGGNDPIHGISAYDRDEPVPHWHFVTYGFTDLFQKETDDPEESGFGFELTFRLAKERDDNDVPAWALNFLQNLGRYVFGTGNRFAAGHKMGLNGPIALGHDTAITAICFADDPELGEITSPHGKASFIQIVGITDDEYRLIQEWSTPGLVDILKSRLPHLVTDLARSSVLHDPATAAEIEQRVAKEGSSEDLTFAGELELAAEPGRVRIGLGALYAATIPRAMRGRIRHERPYELRGRTSSLHLNPAAAISHELTEGDLTIDVTPELARELEATLRPGLAGTYHFEAWPALEIEVTPSFIRGQDGKAIEVRGVADPDEAASMLEVENERLARQNADDEDADDVDDDDDDDEDDELVDDEDDDSDDDDDDDSDDDDDDDDDEDEPEGDEPGVISARRATSGDDDDRDDDEDGNDEEAPPSTDRVAAALRLTERALRLAPDDTDVQFTHAMLLIDGDRAGMARKGDELLARLAQFAPSVRINVAVRMGGLGHARFGEAVDVAVGEPLPQRILADRTMALGNAAIASFGDVAHELFSELGDAILEHTPAKLSRLVPHLPDDVTLLGDLAWKSVQAQQLDATRALYARVIALPIPDETDERQTYLRGVNNACVQAHGAKLYDIAVKLAERVHSVAHENPYIFHAAACAYAAIGDYKRAFDQVKLAVDHNYDHLAKVEADTDLGPLLDWPEFKALFRDWHARQEGN